MKKADNWFDVSSYDAISNTPTLTHLTAIPQGDDNVNLSTKRQGNEIMIRSLQVRGDVSVADSTNLVRIIIFRWLGKSTPLASSILDVTTATTDYYKAHYVLDSSSSFLENYRILYDRTIALAVDSKDSATVKFIKKWKQGLKVEYYNIAGSNFSTGTIWMLAVSDSAAVTHPYLDFNTRVKFMSTL